MNPRRLPHRMTRLFAAATLLCVCAAHADGPAATAIKMADPSQLGALKGGAETARPAIGVPLMAAEGLIRDGHPAEALAKVREAERASVDATPYEIYVLNRVKAAAAMGAGQTELAFAATEAAIESKKLAGAEQQELIASLVHASYGAKDYARAARWATRYAAEGGTRADIAALRLQALYLSGDYAAAVAGMQAQMKADEAAGRTPTERELQVLVSAQRQLKDDAGVLQTMERLATRYPKPAYWADLLARVDRQALSERLFLDFFRLMRASGNLTAADQHLAFAALALDAGFPAETLSLLDDASTRGLLSAPKDAAAVQGLRAKAQKQSAEDRVQRQRDEASARAAKDGNALAMLGQVAVTEGRVDAGIAMIEQALTKGGVRRSDEVMLRLAQAQLQGGRAEAAAQTLARVKGGEAGTLAHLWTLYATRAQAPTVASTPTEPSAASKKP